MAADGIAMEPMATRSASDVGLYPADEDEPMMTSTRKKEKLSSTDTESLLPEEAALRRCCCGCCSRGCCAFSSVALVALLIVNSVCRSSCYSMQIDCAAHGSNAPCLEANTGLVCWSVLVPRAMYASTFYNSLMQPSATRRKAQEYFESQLPLVEASAREFECLEYWCRDLRVMEVETPFYDMVNLRFDMMHAKQLADPRADDFRFEKNKCEMNRWLARNRLPRHRTHHMWSANGQWGGGEATKQTVVDDILANRTGGTCPMVIEFCHLTQWDQRKGAVVDVWSPEWLQEHRSEVEAWLGKKWATRANDWARQWVVPHNAVTNTLVPSLMVQAPFPGTLIESFGNGDPAVADADDTVVELDVHVIWGRAYMAVCHNMVFLRDGSIEIYAGLWRGVLQHAHVESEWLTWVVSEGHLERAWLVAEAAALSLGMDDIRFDLYMSKGRPDDIIFNKNSISSSRDPKLRHHYDLMAQAWAKGHVDRWFKHYTQPDGKRTYELSRFEPPFPNEQRLQQYLADHEELARKVGLL